MLRKSHLQLSFILKRLSFLSPLYNCASVFISLVFVQNNANYTVHEYFCFVVECFVFKMWQVIYQQSSIKQMHFLIGACYQLITILRDSCKIIKNVAKTIKLGEELYLLNNHAYWVIFFLLLLFNKIFKKLDCLGGLINDKIRKTQSFSLCFKIVIQFKMKNVCKPRIIYWLFIQSCSWILSYKVFCCSKSESFRLILKHPFLFSHGRDSPDLAKPSGTMAHCGTTVGSGSSSA